MRSRITPIFLFSTLLLALTTSGCGQKGPLYLPDAAPSPAPAPATAPSPAR